MTIGILGGTGRLGRALAARLAGSGLPVLLGSRSPERARETVAALRAEDAALAIEPADLADAARADAVVLAVPFAAVD
ncbi:MAG TPA: SDR family NAD(P)-dependent oxidoreductase, partial [Vicinamibacterales bacterium]|nr:SDR family NAD(P)-dependent oxidoreductase [Vicinamibacterales bacterium]